MNLSDYGRSIIRTVVPLIVGTVVAWLASRGINIDQATLLPLVDTLVAGAYYAVIRAAEKKWPSMGWMLGAPGAPSYASSVTSPQGIIPVQPSSSASSDISG